MITFFILIIDYKTLKMKAFSHCTCAHFRFRKLVDALTVKTFYGIVFNLVKTTILFGTGVMETPNSVTRATTEMQKLLALCPYLIVVYHSFSKYDEKSSN